jgi:hypothetical protein
MHRGRGYRNGPRQTERALLSQADEELNVSARSVQATGRLTARRRLLGWCGVTGCTLPTSTRVLPSVDRIIDATVDIRDLRDWP